MNDNTNVVIPIRQTAITILTCKKANVIPTASASILVATDKIQTYLRQNFFSCFLSSSLSNASLIIFPPIIASNTNATQ